MKKRKKEIIVRDEQQIDERSAVAENCHAPFSHDQNNELLDKNSKSDDCRTNQSLEEGIQINIDEAMNEAEEQRNNVPPVKGENEQINEAEEAVAGRKSKKKRWGSLIMMLINIVIVVVIIVTQINGDNMVPLSEILEGGINWWFLLVCFATFGVMTILEGVRIEIFAFDSTKKHQFILSYKTAQIGRYYDCVTPMATGGQPFQIYYLKKHGLTAAQSVAVPLGKYAINQITSIIFYITVLISSFFGTLSQGGVATTVVSAASWVGLVLNCGVIFLVILFSISKKAGSKLVGGVIKLGHKMKLVKNYEKTYESILKIVDDFQTSMRYYIKNPKTFILGVFFTAVSLILNYTIPFFIYCTFAGYEAGLWGSILIRCVMIDLASSFIPLPGGTGAAELSFTTLFASFFVGGKLFWALLLWRILTYYGYIFQGLIIIIYDYVIGDKKYNWQKRKNELETESEKFKAEQLSQFKSRKMKKIKK